jgi:hypothetical protein
VRLARSPARRFHPEKCKPLGYSEFIVPHRRHAPKRATYHGGTGEMRMSVSVGAASAGSDEAREAARAERAFFLVLAAVIALEGWALAWFLG